MYRVEMYQTIKTLKEKGFSKRKISRELGIHRKTVNKILKKISRGQIGPSAISKEKILDKYKDLITGWIEQAQTSVLIHEYLKERHSVQVAYPTVVKYVRSLKHGEIYIPLLCEPGEEAQVDFGYLGRFYKGGKWVKVWCFEMVLSHSRYSYQEIVLDQGVSTFIGCHIHAFEYFGGVPCTVKIDNLKAGVITPSFYEPVIQEQYAEFLSHYGSLPITARINRGEDKGKVESGIKYIKNNFLKRIEHKDYERLQEDINLWRDNICNKRVHGTTRKIPSEVFGQVEKPVLKPLPLQRYEIYHIEERKACVYFHVMYQYNYYSVPYEYAGEKLLIKNNGALVKIYKDQLLIATHMQCDGKGEYITREEHKPPYKQRKSKEYYTEKINAIGINAKHFMEELEQIRPKHWHDMIRGIISLEKRYTREDIDRSCARAIAYGALSYQEVKAILEKGLYKQEEEQLSFPELGGYSHQLQIYDQL